MFFTEGSLLHNGNQTALLADCCILSQTSGVSLDGTVRGQALGVDAQDSTPLGKAGTSGIVCLAPLAQSIQTHGVALIIRTRQGCNASW